jgi:outer membrane protein TolC
MKTLRMVLLVLGWQGVAFAQATPPPAPVQPAVPVRPKAPPVDDPLLAPAPRPARVLSSWADAVEYVRTRSTDLRTSLDQVLKAEALSRAALAKYLPTITGTGGYQHELITNVGPARPVAVMEGLVNSTTTPIPNTLTGSIVLTQALFNAQAFDQIGVARVGEEVARFSVDDKRRTLILAVADQIVAVVTAERSAEVNRAGLRAALELHALAKQREALGGATTLDTLRAEQNAEDARAAVVAGDEVLREAREALGLSLGVPEETGVDPSINLDTLGGQVMTSCHAVKSIEERPDVAAAARDLEGAKRALRNVWFGFLPTVTGSSTAYASTSMPVGFPNPVWDVQALLTVPIWDGGTQYANLRTARANEDMADQQLTAVRRAGIIGVQQAQRQLVVSDQADRVARRQRDVAARGETLTETAYLGGQATSLELVTASATHRQAELNATVKDLQVVRAKLDASLALATCSW